MLVGGYACQAAGIDPTASAASHEPPAADPSNDPTSSPATPRATAAPTPASTSPPSISSRGLRAAIDAGAIRERLADLARITERHGGNRAVGSPGYKAAAAFVAARLEAAGYSVVRHGFEVEIDGLLVASSSVIVELPGRTEDEVVMLGAHLDSVAYRAGINDNGSGAMTLLALAERLPAFERPTRTVRFAFWGAEEPGYVGSSAYVASLDAAARRRIRAYLNFDMLGSPNFVRFAYADASAAPGSEAITELFTNHFDDAGLAWDTFDLGGKTDHAPFAAAGIPTGGLFSGGGEAKTEAQAAAMGGTPGIPADACDEAACDTLANVNAVVLGQMADAMAHALAVLAER